MISMIKYHLILNLREKTMVFWTLAFPLILATFFYFGIGGVDESFRFAPIPVAIEENLPENPEKLTRGGLFSQFVRASEGELLEASRHLDSAEAQQLLEDGAICGIFQIEQDDITLTVGKTGMNESILTAVLESFLQKSAILEDLQSDFPLTPEGQARYARLVDSLREAGREYVADVSLGGNEVSSVTSYYFALLAMACLYMCFLGETAAKRTQANISEIGKRICVSPCHRLKVILSNGVSAYLIALVNIAIIMGFLILAVKGIDISMHPGYGVLTAMMGCLIGVTFGILIESIGKWSQNIKSAVLIGATMFCAFLAGLMIGTMKDIVEKHAPLINRLNPAALIADSFYCICVYDDMQRLQSNLLIIGGMSLCFLIGAWLLTRRVRYDSL